MSPWLFFGQFRAGKADKSKSAPPRYQAGACSVPDAGQTHDIYGVHIAVLKELVMTAGKDNGTELVHVFPVFTSSPLVSSSVYNSQKAIHGSTI